MGIQSKLKSFIYMTFNIKRILSKVHNLSKEQNHTEFIVDILRDESVTSFLEVGVNEGANLLELAKKHPNISFFGVDPYFSSLNEIKDEIYGIHKTIYNNDKYSEMLQKLKVKNLTNVKLIKKTSVEAAKDFEDNSLDFIFIDGLHSYSNVREDIESWLAKIKYGGILSGHDFSLEWFSVVRAVEDTLGLDNIIVNVPSKVWIYRKSASNN